MSFVQFQLFLVVPSFLIFENLPTKRKERERERESEFCEDTTTTTTRNKKKQAFDALDVKAHFEFDLVPCTSIARIYLSKYKFDPLAALFVL